MVDAKEREAYERVARHAMERFSGTDGETARKIGNARENIAKDGSEPGAGDYSKRVSRRE